MKIQKKILYLLSFVALLAILTVLAKLAEYVVYKCSFQQNSYLLLLIDNVKARDPVGS